MPEVSDMLIMRRSGELIKGALILNIFFEISSHPHKYIQGKEWIIFSISPVDVLWETILINGRLDVRDK